MQTARLVGERAAPGHRNEMRRLHRDVEVAATLGGVRSDTWIRQALARMVEHWERHEFGFWMFQDADDARFVGRGGLRRIEIEGTPETEIAYALLPEFWGRGLATEIAEVSARVAFEELSLDDVVAFTLPGNRASRRVMEKAGLTYEREILHADVPHVLYRRRSRP